MTQQPINQLRIRPLAVLDLREIVQYLDHSSHAASESFLDHFYEAAMKLAQMPGMGPLRMNRGRLKGLRSWPLVSFGPYVVFYLPSNDGGIEIVRVLHGSRDIARILRKR